VVYAFISYSRKDIEHATKINARLNAQDIRTWQDTSDIDAGEYWDDEIEGALSSATLSHVLVLISQNSINSENVKNEIVYALNEQKQVIPVIIGDFDKLPLNLVRRHYIDLRLDFDDGIEELLEIFSQYQEPQRVASINVPSSYSILKLTPQQLLAAQDENTLVRLVASPGTGKSLVIEERIRWLLSKGVNPKSISVVSFTRASSRDLRARIINFCTTQGYSGSDQVSVTTLHSLAMKVLRKAKQLHYPAEPQVLDKWELENIFDLEFSQTVRNAKPGLEAVTPSRAEDIRLAWEAFWNTGRWDAPSYIPPSNPVTDVERKAFADFHQSATQVYSCVLPGEIIKKVIDGMEAGLFDPVSLLEINHFIVDEFQDLNYTDLQFVDAFIYANRSTYVTGDDDQSLYSFRYAYPTGIQTFSQTYTWASDRQLTECFRSTPSILNTAKTLIVAHPTDERISKQSRSFCEGLEPTLNGVAHRWKFLSSNAEFNSIANSCRLLIDQGIMPRDILILISNKKALLARESKDKPSLLQQAFDSAGISVEMPTGVRYVDTEAGRMVYALIRVACDQDLQDYIAHRTLLGLLRGVGKAAYIGIRKKVVLHNLNYLDMFYNPIPSGVFTSVEVKALNKVREVCQQLLRWSSDDRVVDRIGTIESLLSASFDDNVVQELRDQIAHFPEDMNLGEWRSYISTDNSEQQESILQAVYTRLQLPVPDDGILPQQVRVMTMHGAKGLNADIVFIPGLEEDVLPGEKRARYSGLIQEAARMLYVSITRARIGCILSYSTMRKKYGQPDFGRSGSRYCLNLGGRFLDRLDELSDDELSQIIEAKRLFREHTETRLSQLS
jgi:DNA helicase-2/ATP-dependent DNA helicase PcrA